MCSNQAEQSTLCPFLPQIRAGKSTRDANKGHGDCRWQYGSLPAAGVPVNPEPTYTYPPSAHPRGAVRPASAVSGDRVGAGWATLSTPRSLAFFSAVSRHHLTLHKLMAAGL